MKLQAARIGKPHGIKGAATVQVLTSVPEERFVPGASFETEPPENGPLTLRSASWNKQVLLLSFDGIEDRNAAEALRGTVLLVDDADSLDDEEEGWYEHELLDFAVEVDGQVIGRVTGLKTGAVQDLLEVSTPEEERVLVPFVEQIVPEIDAERRTVVLTPPEGLLSLNERAGAPEDAENPEDTEPDAAESVDAEPQEVEPQDAEPHGDER